MDPVTGGALVDENRETETAGIFACGNVLQVHDLVDYVSDEAEIAGQGAAKFVLSGKKAVKSVKTAAGNGVRYVLPQRISECENDISLFLRVDKPYGKVRFTVSSGDKTLASVIRLKAAPGEMEKLTVKAEKMAQVSDTITVSLEELS